ncbi:MAG: hypothetical protein JSV71_03290, partial [Nitrospiraceae bacterium]
MENNEQKWLELSEISTDALEALLLDSAIDPTQLTDIIQKNTHRPEILQFLLNHPNTPASIREFVAQTLHLPVPVIEPDEKSIPHMEDESLEKEWIEKRRVQSLFQTVQKLKVGEKILLALRGSKEIRTLLLRDSSREVIITVLDNPKMTESEVEILAKQKTTSDDILRKISKKREWLKNYSILHGLVCNPKTPIAIAMSLLPR